MKEWYPNAATDKLIRLLYTRRLVKVHEHHGTIGVPNISVEREWHHPIFKLSVLCPPRVNREYFGGVLAFRGKMCGDVDMKHTRRESADIREVCVTKGAVFVMQ